MGGPEWDVDPPSDGTGGDELLDTGPRRTVPRWAVVLAVLVVVAGLAVGIVATHHDSRHPSSTPTPTPTPSTGPTQPVEPEVYDLLADAPARRVIALVGGRLVAYDTAGHRVATSTGTVQSGGGPESQVQVVIDTASQVVWAVRYGTPLEGPAVGTAQAYSARTLRLVDTVALPGVVSGGATLDGRFLVAAQGRLWAATADARSFRPLASISGGAFNLVADPSRHRLLYSELASQGPGRLLLYPQDESFLTEGTATVSATRAVVTSPRVVPAQNGAVTVVGDAIWLVGTGRIAAPGAARTRGDGQGAQIERLDPSTLAAGPDVAVDAVRGGTGTTLVGSGTSTLFVRPQPGSEQVLCLDGRTGALRQRFTDLVGQFVTLGRTGYLGEDGGVRLVPLAGCAG